LPRALRRHRGLYMKGRAKGGSCGFGHAQGGKFLRLL
jgi:hypothetical protein